MKVVFVQHPGSYIREELAALGDAFDVNPDLFANLQCAYNIARAREPDPSVGRVNF